MIFPLILPRIYGVVAREIVIDQQRFPNRGLFQGRLFASRVGQPPELCISPSSFWFATPTAPLVRRTYVTKHPYSMQLVMTWAYTRLHSVTEFLCILTQYTSACRLQNVGTEYSVQGRPEVTNLPRIAYRPIVHRTLLNIRSYENFTSSSIHLLLRLLRNTFPNYLVLELLYVI